MKKEREEEKKIKLDLSGFPDFENMSKEEIKSWAREKLGFLGEEKVNKFIERMTSDQD